MDMFETPSRATPFASETQPCISSLLLQTTTLLPSFHVFSPPLACRPKSSSPPTSCPKAYVLSIASKEAAADSFSPHV